MTMDEQDDTKKGSASLGRRLLFFSPLAVFLVVAGAFVWGLDPGRDPRFVPTAMLDDPIPDFSYEAVEGVDRPGISSADLTQGKVSVVNFFASWCAPCRIEHPLLTEIAEQGITVQGITHRDKDKDTVRFLEQLGNPYSRVGKDAGRGAIHWGVYGLPETFVVDGKGRIRFHHRGPLTRTDLETKLLPVVEALR